MRRPKSDPGLADRYDLVEVSELRELREIRARALAKTPQGRPPVAGLPLGWALVVTVAAFVLPLLAIWLSG